MEHRKGVNFMLFALLADSEASQGMWARDQDLFTSPQMLVTNYTSMWQRQVYGITTSVSIAQ